MTEKEYEEFKNHIKHNLPILSLRDQKILTMRFGLNGSNEQTLEDVALFFNVTRERIRQIEKKALKELKNKKRTIYGGNAS